MQNKTQVKSAGTKGRGVFATKRIECDEEILRDLCLTLPTWSDLLDHYVYCSDPDPTKGTANLAMGHGSFVNHGTAPNGFWQIEKGKLGLELVIYATRQIKRGEEILISYNGEDNVAWDELDGEWKQ